MKKISQKFILFFLIFSNNYLFSSEMPTLFIGTYNENNPNLIKNLVIPNSSSKKNDGWGLNDYTQKLLQNDFKEKLGYKKFNIILKNEFGRDYKKVVLNADDGADKKIGFFNINTFENSTTLSSGQKLVYITINLTFVEIGEEANRASANSNFEVRYTNGITTTGVLGIQPMQNEEKRLRHGYRSFFKKALGDLIETIILDKNSKKVNSLTSDDIYFSIAKIGIGKRAKELSLKIFKNKKSAKQQILMILQESLIKEIRKDKRLDNVVLLYPDTLNKIIFKNWKDYLKQINSVFLGTSNDSNIIIRKLKRSCSNVKNHGATIYVDGYFIEAMMSELYDKLVKKEDVNSVRYIKSSIVSRVVLSLKRKKSIDGLSTPLNKIKKRKLVVGQASFGYDIVNNLYSTQTNKITKTVRKAIEDMTPKLTKLILDIVEKRKKILNFDYQKLCGP